MLKFEREFIDANCWTFGAVSGGEVEQVNELNAEISKLFEKQIREKASYETCGLLDRNDIFYFYLIDSEQFLELLNYFLSEQF